MSISEKNTTVDNISLLNDAKNYFGDLKDKIETDEKIRRKLNRLNNLFALALIPVSIALAFTETTFSIPLAIAAIISLILVIVLLTYLGERYKKFLLADDIVCNYYLYKSYLELGSYLNSKNSVVLDSGIANFRKYCNYSDTSTDNEKEKLFKRIIDLSQTAGWFKVEPDILKILEVFGSIYSTTEQALSQKKDLPVIHDLFGYLLISYYLESIKLAESPQYHAVIYNIVELYRTLEPVNPEKISHSEKGLNPISSFFKNSLGSGSLSKRVLSWFVFSIILTIVVQLVFIIFKQEVSLNDLIFNVFVLAFTDGLAVSYLAPVVFGKKETDAN